MTMRKWNVAAVLMLAAAGTLCAQNAPATQSARNVAEEGRKLVNAIRPSVVKVEYELQYDKGEAPRGGGWSERCPSCGGYHGGGSGDEFVEQERPMLQSGFALSPTVVLTSDIMLHDRFVKSVSVRVGDQVVPAKPIGYMKNHKAMLLETAKPLPGVSPLQFDDQAKGPYQAVTYAEGDGTWVFNVAPAGGGFGVQEDSREFLKAPDRGIIVDKTGTPVGVVMNGELPANDTWKGSPLKWEGLSAADRQKLLDATEKRADAGIVRMTLNFRSPRKDADSSPYSRYNDDDASATVRHVLGVVVDANTVLVLANLKPNITARLERIRAFAPDGAATELKFGKSLLDYGAFTATSDKPLPGALTLADKGAETLRDRLIATADITLQGEKRVAYIQHRRVSGAEVGWRGKLYPEVPGAPDAMFAFDPAGNLAILPVAQREKAAVRESYRSSYAVATSAAQLRDVLSNLDKHSDPHNIPLTEAQENRLAWLGIELQPLTQELARANNVSDLTKDGDTGALVTYVYPDSPAAKAGIEPGFILLRLHVADQPKPIDVEVETDWSSERGFPWDRLGDAPESVFDRIPSPWSSVETKLTRTLTDLGFGKKFQAEFYHDGKSLMKDMAVTEGPAHWHSAEKVKHEGLGITVRDMTYEVRRYLQKKDADPGVVISKIEMGSKASVSGLKPYELITHVNDKPVKDVKEFEKLAEGQEELRLNVRRMTKGRVVKVKVALATQPATQSATQPATAPAATRAGAE